ncbi:hypothetical protein [Streptomyces canus]|uniref:hypothetical protein n=1 Tax=Streptomyces canus TaxID=58343 RepID=UPI002E321A89|nr:hypothetical protein [Streptomyces canus]
MSETPAVTTELTSQYAAQLTNDIERNTKERERISAELAELQQQLTTLQHDHTVLVNMQQALGIQPAPAEPAATPDSSSVPAPRKKTTGRRATKEQAGAEKSTAARGRATAKKTTDKPAKKSPDKPAAEKADKAHQPTLVELVRRHLTDLSEPRSAAEIATSLDKAHPERGIKTTVVRTTLEGLVAKNHAQRTKQGSSVFYTAPETAEQTSTAPQNKTQPEQAE